MADLSYRSESLPLPRRTDWGAIWSGMFVFAAIWAVFGALGLAIFASRANPNVGAPVGGLNIGISIWAIVLTIIAMYVAGLVTGRLAGVTNRIDGIVHGTTMFGLSVVSALVLVSLSGLAVGNAGVPATTHSAYTLTLFSHVGWAGFIALILGWLAAMAGGAQVATRKPERGVREIRPAA